MKSILLKALFLSAFVSFSLLTVKAQNLKAEENKDRSVMVVGMKKTLSIGGKATYVVIKETSNAAWETTKFATKEIAAPVAKTIIIKAAPKFTKFLIKRGTPIAFKTAVTYLKL